MTEATATREVTCGDCGLVGRAPAGLTQVACPRCGSLIEVASAPRRHRWLWPAIAAVLVIAATITVGLAFGGDDDEPKTYAEIVGDQMASSPRIATKMCTEGPFARATSRAELEQQLGELSATERDDIVENLRATARAEDGLPAAAASWGWPEARALTLAIFDACQARR